MLEEGQIQEGQECSNNEQSQYIKTRKAGRTDICMVCKTILSKYTCPSCKERTCSLTCSRKHKTLRNCSGIADPTKKVLKKDMDEKVVEKDFSFVKQMLSSTDKIKKCLTGVTSQVQQPKRFYFLRKKAKDDYNIKIHQAPSIMERHRQNISFYFMKTKQIYWVLQFLYYKGDKKFTRHVSLPTADSKSISQILPSSFLCPDLLLKDINTQIIEQFCIFVEDRILNEQIKIKKIDKSQKLANALLNMNIYEFPTIYVVHNSLEEQFTKWKNN